MRPLMLAAVWLALTLALTSVHLPERATGSAVKDTPVPVRMVDSGLAAVPPIPGMTTTDAPRGVDVALIVENPNAELAAEGLRLDVRLLDGTGRRTAGRTIAVAQLLPTERRNIVARFELEFYQADAASVEASVAGLLRWRRVDGVPLPTVQLEPPIIGNVPGLSEQSLTRVTPQGDVGRLMPTADVTVTNPLDAFVDGMVIAAIAFDSEGRIVAVGQRVRTAGPGESIQVVVGLNGAPRREIARVEVTAAYPYIDLTPYVH